MKKLQVFAEVSAEGSEVVPPMSQRVTSLFQGNSHTARKKAVNLFSTPSSSLLCTPITHQSQTL